MTKEKQNPLSLIRDRRVAFANLIMAYVRFNIPAVNQIIVLEDGNLSINGNEYKLDVSDYTGSAERYVFFNPSSGRLVIEGAGVQKVYKLEVDLLDH